MFPAEDKYKGEKNTIGNVFDKFGRRTTIQGISHYYQRSGTNGKLWMLCAVFGILITGLHLYLHAKNYFSVPVKTNVVHKAHDFLFPDVTFCSTSPLAGALYFKPNSSNMTSGGYTVNDAMAMGLLYSYKDLNNSNIEKDRLLHRQTIHMQIASGFTLDRGYSLNELVTDCRYQGEICAEDDFHATTNPYYFNCYTFSPKNRSFISVEPEDGLVIILNTHSTTLNQLRDYRQSRANDILLIDSFLATQRRHGLSSSDIFASILTPENEPSGLKMEIHPPRTTPHIRQRGFILSNGRFIEIGLNMLIEEQMNTPGKPCKKNDFGVEFVQHISEDGSAHTQNHRKTYTDCVATVKQHYFKKNCKCLSHLFPIEFPYEVKLCYDYRGFLDRMLKVVKTNMPKSGDFTVYLNYTNNLSKNNSAVANISKEFRKQIRCHDELADKKKLLGNLAGLPACLTSLPCERDFYSWIWSSAEWPRDFDLEHLMNYTFINSFRNITTGKLSRTAHLFVNFTNQNKNWTTTDEIIRKNFLKVLVHPLELMVNAHKEENSYTVWEALSEIGGIIGLWIGMSLLALFELLELLCNSGSYLFNRRERKRNRGGKVNNGVKEMIPLDDGK